MTRRVLLPSETEVQSAAAQLRDASPNGFITVRDLATQLGLANSTFWRHFPGIAQSVADGRRTTVRTAQIVNEDEDDARVAGAEARLRGENAKLREQLQLAVAHIQRLTLENHALRDQLESQSGVARLPNR